MKSISNKINGDIPWISDPCYKDAPLKPVSCFRRSFFCKTTGCATLQITALGLFEAFIDDKSITDELFTPGWCDYRKRIEYRTYQFEITEGEHTFDILLAAGWYAGVISGQNKRRPELLVHLILPDGEIIDSGNAWRCSCNGPICYSDIYEGEYYDERKEWQDWHEPDLKKTDRKIEPFAGNPVKKMEQHEPISTVGNIVDFGQNITGREIICFTAERGDKITIRHAEVLNPDGSLYTENLRKSNSTNVVIAAGGTTVFESHFSFHGFRYVEVCGVKEFKIKANSIRSDYPLHLDFDCSNPLLNQLVSNIRWGWLDNSLDIPTDCPQRDERVGWLGDAQVFIRAAAYLSDCMKFFRRWLKDVRLSCSCDGVYSIVAPYIDIFCQYNVAGWADAGIICPWVLYEFSGNKEILEENYENIRKFIVYRKKEFEKSRLPDAYFGDWLNMNDPTDKEVLAAEFLAYSMTLAFKIATVLNKKEDAELFMKWEQECKNFFVRHYFNRLNSQTGMALALHFNLLPENKRKKCAANLADLIRKKFNTHLSTGFLGTSHLLHALSENGYLDLAWELLEQKTFPSWLFPVLNGATTMWEHWDSWTPENGFKDPKMNSFNHYAYGAVLDWIIGVAAGISPDFNIDPHPGGTLSYMNVTFRGVNVYWKKEDNKYYCTITVPERRHVKFRNKLLSTGIHKFVL